MLPAIVAEADAMLKPGGARAAAVALDRLFAVLPGPEAGAGLEAWAEELAKFPAPVIRDVVAAMIREVKFKPVVADFVERAKVHPVMRAAYAMKGRAWRLERMEPPPPPAEVDPAEVSAILDRFVKRDPASPSIPKGDVSQSRRPLRDIDREARTRPLIPMGDPA